MPYLVLDLADELEELVCARRWRVSCPPHLGAQAGALPRTASAHRVLLSLRFAVLLQPAVCLPAHVDTHAVRLPTGA